MCQLEGDEISFWKKKSSSHDERTATDCGESEQGREPYAGQLWAGEGRGPDGSGPQLQGEQDHREDAVFLWITNLRAQLNDACRFQRCSKVRAQNLCLGIDDLLLFLQSCHLSHCISSATSC